MEEFDNAQSSIQNKSRYFNEPQLTKSPNLAMLKHESEQSLRVSEIQLDEEGDEYNDDAAQQQQSQAHHHHQQPQQSQTHHHQQQQQQTQQPQTHSNH